MPDDKNKQSASFSLQNEIKKRRTQEIQRAIENKKIDQARGGDDIRRSSQSIPVIPAPDPRRASQTIQPLDPRRASQTMQTADPRRASQTTQAVDPRRSSQSIQPLDPRRASQTTQAVDPRRSSQSMQTVDPRRSSQSMQAVDPRRSSQSMQTVDPRRSSQSMQAVDSRRASQTMAGVDTRRGSQTLTTTVTRVHKRRQIMIATIAMLSIVAVCVLTASFAFSRPVEAAGFLLPSRTVADALEYLQGQGIVIANQRLVTPIDPKTWSADELLEFSVQKDGKDYVFLLLGYKDRGLLIGDSMRGELTKNRFQTWKLSPIGTFLFAVPPESDPTLVRELDSHLMSYLLRPYIKELPGPTETPTATPPAGQTAEAGSN